VVASALCIETLATRPTSVVASRPIASATRQCTLHTYTRAHVHICTCAHVHVCGCRSKRGSVCCRGWADPYHRELLLTPKPTSWFPHYSSSAKLPQGYGLRYPAEGSVIRNTAELVNLGKKFRTHVKRLVKQRVSHDHRGENARALSLSRAKNIFLSKNHYPR